MEVTLQLDETQAQQLRRLLTPGHPIPALLQEAVARYLAEREQIEHRRAVMEAILTGEPIATA
jgi:hypothetical protein